jgi:Cu/Ag efflux protein CusF
MRKLLTAAALAALTLGGLGAARAQVTQNASAPRPARQQHLIGEVAAVDASTGRLTVKTDAGASVEVVPDAQTVFKRIPPGQSSLDRAEAISRTDVRVGDRVLVPNGAGGGAAPRQVIIMARAALDEQREREREERRRRTLGGRVTAVDAARREITVQARGREGVQAVTVSTTEATRFLRFAPDSLRTEHARAGALADVRVGDQFRATGERDPSGARFAAEEVMTGTVTRVAGRITAVDAARGEVTVRNEQMNETFTVTLGERTSLRRMPAEFAAQLAERRERRERRRAGRDERQPGPQDSPGPRPRRNQEGDGGGREGQPNEGGEGRRGAGGGRGEGRGPRGGRNFQQAFENFPAVTLAELKKGDSVLVTATAGADATRLTAVSLVTGDAELLRLLQRGAGGERNLSPGLPGDVMGGGAGGREQP